MSQKQLPLQIDDVFNKGWLNVFYIVLLFTMWPLLFYINRTINYESKYGYRYIILNEDELILIKYSEEVIKININDIQKISISKDEKLKNKLVFDVEISCQNQNIIFDSSCLATLRIFYHQLRPYIDFEFKCTDVWYHELNSNGQVSKFDAIIISMIIFLFIIFLLIL
jgi:hypothetical protein